VSVPADAGGPSLHRQLLWWLLLPQVVLWAAAALFTYNLAARYANEAIDASLLQASRALARQIKPTASGLFIDFPRSAQEILEADPNDRVLYAVSSPPGQLLLGDQHIAAPSVPAPRVGEPYFYDAAYPEPALGAHGAAAERVRVVALFLKFGIEGTSGGTMLVQVARSRANREELARRILLDTALPLSALIGLMTIVVWAGIRAGLRPLEHLQDQVEGRAANDLAPIELRAAPPEVRSLARALNTLLAEVGRHIASQKRFISDAAHQLRTPLAGLKGQTELAMGEVSDPALVARLQRVHDGATRSAHLVAQLLTLTRAEPEAAAHHDWVTVDLRRLARETTAELVPRALAAHVDLGFDEGEGAPDASASVRGIPLLLREALSNLIDNAIRYAGRDATITVRVGADASDAWIEVEDDGPGLPADELEHVFERFVRGTQDGSGCGLGLAIVREIVERHGGRARLAGVAPHGLVARMSLPVGPVGLRKARKG
jgi:two-component system, OmpR family, sensor histidine kinase TctE